MTYPYIFQLNSTMTALKAQLWKEAQANAVMNRGRWQSQEASSEQFNTYEIPNALVILPSMQSRAEAAERLEPDLPWADAHFAERVGGVPLNPPPSHVDWPWHKGNESRHLDEIGEFAHTYPERFWPKRANLSKGIHTGVRFDYGDLNDVIHQLREDPFTRQAYLPIFFPEDTGSREGQRVPCTLGYHFIRNGASIDCNYFLRSCDLTRHFANDAYFTNRLLNHVVQQVKLLGPANDYDAPFAGTVTMFISNLHVFQGDMWRYR